MLRLNDLVGRAVVDVEAAAKLGHVDDLILDPEGCRVAALVVVSGQSFLGGGTHRVLSAAAVHSIGPDAVTVHGSAVEPLPGQYDHLPRRRDIAGRKVVGESGKMFGHINDILVDPADGRIIGYSMADNPLGGLENILTGVKPATREYLRADAELRVGHDLVVVPDDAIIPAEPGSSPHPGSAAGGGWSTATSHQGASAWKPAVTPATVSPTAPTALTTPTAPAGPAPLDHEAGYEEMRVPATPLPEAGTPANLHRS